MVERNDWTPITVVVVDDHPLVREGTQACLTQASGIVVVGTAGDGTKAMQLVAELLPQVLILDVRLPDISGVEVAQRVRKSFPKTAVLVVTGYDDVGYLRALLRVGISGYLRKTASSAEIVAAVRALATGRSEVGLDAARAAAEPAGEPLTAREQEVLRMVVYGKRNAEIAEALVLSLKTVEFHVSRLLQKLGARSRTDAIRKAIQQGLTPLNDCGDGPL